MKLENHPAEKGKDPLQAVESLELPAEEVMQAKEVARARHDVV